MAAIFIHILHINTLPRHSFFTMMQALKTKVNFVSSSSATGKMRTGSTIVASAAPRTSALSIELCLSPIAGLSGEMAVAQAQFSQFAVYPLRFLIRQTRVSHRPFVRIVIQIRTSLPMSLARARWWRLPPCSLFRLRSE